MSTFIKLEKKPFIKKHFCNAKKGIFAMQKKLKP